MTTFEALGVAETLVRPLPTAGITDAFPIQELTIPDALAGRDVCGKAKTGSGKTLAFGLAAAAAARTANRPSPAARWRWSSCPPVSWRSRSPRSSTPLAEVRRLPSSPSTAVPTSSARSSSSARASTSSSPPPVA